MIFHGGYETSQENTAYIMDRLFNLTQTYFPKTPVYATLGNHEAHPADTYFAVLFSWNLLIF